MGIDQVYALTEHQEEFSKPARIKKYIAKRDRTMYCVSHRDIGHNTSDCFNLEAIEALIRRERLQKYRRQDPGQSDEKYDKQYNEIAKIAGGQHIAGTSRRAQKTTSEKQMHIPPG